MCEWGGCNSLEMLERTVRLRLEVAPHAVLDLPKEVTEHLNDIGLGVDVIEQPALRMGRIEGRAPAAGLFCLAPRLLGIVEQRLDFCHVEVSLDVKECEKFPDLQTRRTGMRVQ